MSSPITTHVLDTSRGRPARGIAVRLDRREKDGSWRELAHGRTNADGRVGDLLPAKKKLGPGEYQLTFETGPYFKSAGIPAFYPSVTVVFEIHHSEPHYHVPLLLSPFGYSTYRGS
jgi:5-hydroxyisourate hydrolase